MLAVRNRCRIAAQGHGGFEDGLDLVVANAGQLNARGGLNDPGHTEANIAESLMTNVAGSFLPRAISCPSCGPANPAALPAPGKFAVISSQMGSSTRSGTSAPILSRFKGGGHQSGRGHWRWNWPLSASPSAPGTRGMGSDRYGRNRGRHPPGRPAPKGCWPADALTMDSSGIFETRDGEVMPFNDPLRAWQSVRDHASRLFPGGILWSDDICFGGGVIMAGDDKKHGNATGGDHAAEWLPPKMRDIDISVPYSNPPTDQLMDFYASWAEHYDTDLIDAYGYMAPTDAVAGMMTLACRRRTLYP